MRVRKTWHNEDWDICCLFSVISSVPGTVSGTQKMLNKHLVNKQTNERSEFSDRKGRN